MFWGLSPAAQLSWRPAFGGDLVDGPRDVNADESVGLAPPGPVGRRAARWLIECRCPDQVEGQRGQVLDQAQAGARAASGQRGRRLGLGGDGAAGGEATGLIPFGQVTVPRPATVQRRAVDPGADRRCQARLQAEHRGISTACPTRSRRSPVVGRTGRSRSADLLCPASVRTYFGPARTGDRRRPSSASLVRGGVRAAT